jgi:hypothetical protein
VPGKGRLPLAILEAYREAQSQQAHG